MSWTKLDLQPHLDPLFDKCIKDVAAVPQGVLSAGAVVRLKAACLTAAKKEIDRQGGIYTAEEQAYVNKIKSMHQEAKPLTATLVDYTQKLALAWNDGMFAEMPDKVEHVGEMAKEARSEMAAAVAHQGWRGNQPWNPDKAVAAVGKDGQDELFALFKAHRDPMIAATGDLKTFVIKLEEFRARAMDSLKTAEACKARSTINFTEFREGVKALQAKSIKAKQDIEAKVKSQTANLQSFIVLCNTQKTKLDPIKVKAADGTQGASEIWLKNSKTTTKTMEVELGNAELRVNKSVFPAQLGTVKGELADAKKNLEDARKFLGDFNVTLEAHKKKLTEAKTRK